MAMFNAIIYIINYRYDNTNDKKKGITYNKIVEKITN